MFHSAVSQRSVHYFFAQVEGYVASLLMKNNSNHFQKPNLQEDARFLNTL
ncbi:hypothetical protein PEPS_33580 (plasmid) [Persicobacter psychrovividus]|uniref:Uncharacterized protein n=1 Tax=Persicobacter psychrovividus TaxID=387638 RepID=A0ABM7VJC5_9BACT|nr:hypothetical protein PEPS_33580 [Persicobacter psychrovividus]